MCFPPKNIMGFTDLVSLGTSNLILGWLGCVNFWWLKNSSHQEWMVKYALQIVPYSHGPSWKPNTVDSCPPPFPRTPLSSIYIFIWYLYISLHVFISVYGLNHKSIYGKCVWNLHPGLTQRLSDSTSLRWWTWLVHPNTYRKHWRRKWQSSQSGKVAVDEQHHTTSEEATHTAKNSGIHVIVFFGGGDWFPIFFEGPNVTEPYM